MADCTKTVEFLQEWGRMCDPDGKGCAGCPMSRPIRGHIDLMCIKYVQMHPEGAIAIVQKWSDEHPAMTWAGKLRELIPGADIETIIDLTCPKHYFGDLASYCTTDAIKCEDCWNGEYKEAEK